jgi:hypothetical protein
LEYPALAIDEPSDWARTEVDEARSKGLILAPADLNYQENINRMLFCMQVVNMVEVALGAPVTLTIANPFSDIDNEYVTKAYQLGIVNGVSAAEFAPFSYITRQEIAAMMMRSARALDLLAGKAYADVSGTESITFADQSDIATWALSDIRLANSLGVMLGVGDNKINPLGNTTVQESILLVNRIFDGFEAASMSGSGTGTTGNTAPTALSNQVQFSVSEQTVLVIEADQLATDADGDVLTVVAINGQTAPYSPPYGTAELTSDGKISYISDDITEDLLDDFVVTVSDGINVTHINIRVNLTHSLFLVIRPTVGSVTVSGNPTVGSTVSANLIMYIGGIPSPAATLCYQWMRASTAGGTYIDIPGATSSAYTIPASDVGKYLKLRVTASGSAGGSAKSAALGPATNSFAGGDGSSVSPYEIATVEQLLLLNDMTTDGKYFKLTEDITLPANTFITSTFNGTLYGYAHMVTIYITTSTDNDVGLFAQIGSSAEVNGIRVDGYIDIEDYVAGGISGRNEGLIKNCTAYLAVQSGAYAGSIAGVNDGIIMGSFADGYVSTGYYAGGITGYNNGSIVRCHTSSSAWIIGSTCAGGIAGTN